MFLHYLYLQTFYISCCQPEFSGDVIANGISICAFSQGMVGALGSFCATPLHAQ
mgnify:CR=1 FL=1